MYPCTYDKKLAAITPEHLEEGRRGSRHLQARKHEMCDGNFRQLDDGPARPAPFSVLRRRVGGRIKPRHVPNVCMHAVSLPPLPPSPSLLYYARSAAAAGEDCLSSLDPQLHKDAQILLRQGSDIQDCMLSSLPKNAH